MQFTGIIAENLKKKEKYDRLELHGKGERKMTNEWSLDVLYSGLDDPKFAADQE